MACARALPVLEGYLATYPGLSITAVYVGLHPMFGELLTKQDQLTFPTAWDVESETWMRYRIRNIVFPLRVVLGGDGRVVFKGTTEEADASLHPEECADPEVTCPCDGQGDFCLTRAAIEAALAGG